MKKLFLYFSLLFFSVSVLAGVNYSDEFKDKPGCFLLYNLNQNKWAAQYNPKHCKQRIPANSTFKLPLSVIAFDQNLINQKSVFKWDGQPQGFTEREWDQDQTPRTWLERSVIWVSQNLATQLGLNKMKTYMKKLNYGNQDFSGGLTTAWLSSSLKISPEEQINFLKGLVNETLPVSKKAMEHTKENMLLETTPNGWKLYGKTGSGISLYNNGRIKKGLQDGWFIGFIQKDKETFLFALDFSDKTVAPGFEEGGKRAKAMVISILKQLNQY